MELWGNYIAYQLFYHEFIWACLVFWYSVILYSNYSFFKQCPLLLKQHNALERPTSRELAQDNFNNNSGRSKIFVDLFSYLVVRRLFFTFGPTKEYNTSESCVGSDQMPSGCWKKIRKKLAWDRLLIFFRKHFPCGYWKLSLTAAVDLSPLEQFSNECRKLSETSLAFPTFALWLVR